MTSIYTLSSNLDSIVLLAMRQFALISFALLLRFHEVFGHGIMCKFHV